MKINMTIVYKIIKILIYMFVLIREAPWPYWRVYAVPGI